MAIITLTTDFGYKDHFVAGIKGTILNEVPNANIVDISHAVSPLDVQECAYILKNAYPYFPNGTIHIIGMDSEVSPENQHIAAELNGHYFIGANNGVISLIAKELNLDQLVEINIPNTSINSFPSMEIFTKVASHLARGGKLGVVSKPFKNLKEIRELEPRVTNDGRTIIGNVIYTDNYGNVVTNITKAIFEAYRNGRAFEIIARRQKITSIHNSYNSIINFELPENKRLGPSDLLALFNSSGYIELAIYKSDLKSVGGASTLLGLKHLDMITINFL
ncbi:SAM hydrolase/SAM-dependent halogenase family protein [Croceitalea rosinachiae]|uniref:SAM-dependent chlorinase/fluorinase n=1 Tax=Croceitalea rosinachiae TaxID=3075596 RepID=A0ABU3AC91_9FLAO|nr:SAM-dependent chlorinase/fluorinase [Croceitalea sp. F388]MDT0607809.1 SAM-dependent chlorinase/fluorinase [Croceitalea sp. F388]